MAATRWKPEAGSRKRLRRNVADLRRVKPLEELRGLLAIELRIPRLEEQEEPVARGAREPLDVERGVIRLRQAVQHDHADDRRQRREEDRQLEAHRYELRPAVERLAADVDRVRDLVNPLLQADAGRQTPHTAAE